MIHGIQFVKFLSSSSASLHIYSFTHLFNQPANQKMKTNLPKHLLHQFNVWCYGKYRDGWEKPLCLRNSVFIFQSPWLLLYLAILILAVPFQDTTIYIWVISTGTSQISVRLVFNQTHKARYWDQGTHRLSFKFFLPFAPSRLSLPPSSLFMTL